tara:strand:- start:540 stop:794 length:255 start_codon:yes stop_codon:yes gene_type:complete
MLAHSCLLGSVQAQDAIHELENVAEQLGFDVEDLGLDHLHSKLDELIQHEDQQADMQEEEWHFARHHERLESRAIDDILDSIRE